MSRNRGLLPLAGVAFCSAQIWQVPYQRHQFIISRRQEKHHSRQQESPSGEILVPDLTTPHRIMRTWVILWHFSLWINWLIYQNNVATAILIFAVYLKELQGRPLKYQWPRGWTVSRLSLSVLLPLNLLCLPEHFVPVCSRSLLKFCNMSTTW